MPLPNGPAIKAIRQAKKLSGVKAAEAAGITHGHLYNMESPIRGKHASDGVLTKLAAFLGVPFEAIVVPAPVAQKTRRPSVKQAA